MGEHVRAIALAPSLAMPNAQNITLREYRAPHRNNINSRLPLCFKENLQTSGQQHNHCQGGPSTPKVCILDIPWHGQRILAALRRVLLLKRMH